ncbi:hypothetical protein CBG25_10290 [Arsenophonus sp. ENCA]|nr:hypothetical protein CBG25_10290 [Arsenophonus sp. ENCA]
MPFSKQYVRRLPVALFQLDLPEYLAEISLISLFIGALIWLAGARVSGHEGIADRYWWLRNFDERHRR